VTSPGLTTQKAETGLEPGPPDSAVRTMTLSSDKIQAQNDSGRSPFSLAMFWTVLGQGAQVLP
jgi:hypothetical protein